MTFIEKGQNKQALVHIDKAKLWPENLGVGKPYYCDERLIDFVESLAWRNLKDNNKSKELLLNIERRPDNTKMNDEEYLVTVLAEQKLGNDKKIREYLSKWKETVPESLLWQWVSEKNEKSQLR